MIKLKDQSTLLLTSILVAIVLPVLFAIYKDGSSLEINLKKGPEIQILVNNQKQDKTLPPVK